jgi:hypothetical protein
VAKVARRLTGRFAFTDLIKPKLDQVAYKALIKGIEMLFLSWPRITPLPLVDQTAAIGY